MRVYTKSLILSEEVKTAYQILMNYVEERKIPLEISFESFKKEYGDGQYENLEQYLNAHYQIAAPELKKVANL